jgi:hypothetical protein
VNLSDLFRKVNDRMSEGRVRAHFYPYRELKHTWRLDDGVLSFKVSDYMKGASEDVLESLAWFLVCRARRKECPAGMSRMYRDHVRSSDFWRARRQLYLSRAKSLSFKPRGSARDLEAVFSYVNSKYFGDGIEKPDLAWVRESPRSRVGFYHSPLRILAVNRVLDNDRIPRYVLEFVMYHELLHDTIEHVEGPFRRTAHTKEFRLREREFPKHDEAQKWLGRIVGEKAALAANEIVPQA